MKNFIGFVKGHKKLVMFLIVTMIAAASIFAQQSAADSSGMKDVNQRVFNIVDFFNGKWVRGIACVALIAECIGLLFAGGQNPQVFKKFLPLIAGTIIFMCAGKIVTIIFGTNDANFSDDLDGNAYLLPETPRETDSLRFSIDGGTVTFSTGLALS